MFVRGMRGLKGLGDFNTYSWKEENWWKPGGAATSIIPGVSNTTAAAVGAGGIAVAGAGIWALGKYFKWW